MRDRRRQIPEVEVLLRAVINKMNHANSRLETIMADLTKLTAAAARTNAGIEYLLSNVADLKAQIAALTPDPAEQAKIDEVADGLNAEADKIPTPAAPPAP